MEKNLHLFHVRLHGATGHLLPGLRHNRRHFGFCRQRHGDGLHLALLGHTGGWLGTAWICRVSRSVAIGYGSRNKRHKSMGNGRRHRSRGQVDLDQRERSSQRWENNLLQKGILEGYSLARLELSVVCCTRKSAP